MALLLNPERSVKEEIVSLAATLADAQERLQELAARIQDSETDPEGWQAKFDDLNRQTTNGTKWFQTQIASLEQRLDQQKPEMDNLLAARNAAFTKLKHARKVIRDLLDERRDMASPRGSLTQEDIDQALSDEMPREDGSNSSGSDETVRIGGARTISPPISARLSPSISSAGRQDRASDRASSSSSSRAPTSPRSTPSRSTRSSPQKEANLYWKTGPACSRGAVRVAWAQLGECMPLDDDTLISLESFESTSDVSMGLHLTQLPNKEVVAFVYGPLLLALDGRSFIIDFGQPGSNNNMSAYVNSFIKKQKTFHTFHFPMTSDDWYYVGSLRWRVAPTDPSQIWPLPSGEGRAKFLKKMCSRTKGEVTPAELERQLDSGEIVQLSIELSCRDEDHQRSQVFAAQVLRQGGEGTVAS